MSDSLRPYSTWNSPVQNTRVGSLSFLQGIFPTRDQTQVSCIAGGFLTSWATGKPKNTGVDSLFLLQHIFPGIEPGSPALQEDSLPTELWGKPYNVHKIGTKTKWSKMWKITTIMNYIMSSWSILGANSFSRWCQLYHSLKRIDMSLVNNVFKSCV